MINSDTAMDEPDKGRIFLHSNIILYEPNDKVYEHFEIIPDLIEFIGTIYHRFYHNTLVINPNMGEIGFELLGLGVTNKVTFCDDSAQKCSYYKQISFNHYIPYHVDTVVCKYPVDIPKKNYDLIVITIPDAVVEKASMLQEYLEHIRPALPLTADVLVIENNDDNEDLYNHTANVTGFYHETTRIMGKRAVMHYKLQHDFIKATEGFTKSLRGFFAKI